MSKCYLGLEDFSFLAYRQLVLKLQASFTTFTLYCAYLLSQSSKQHCIGFPALARQLDYEFANYILKPYYQASSMILNMGTMQLYGENGLKQCPPMCFLVPTCFFFKVHFPTSLEQAVIHNTIVGITLVVFGNSYPFNRKFQAKHPPRILLTASPWQPFLERFCPPPPAAILWQHSLPFLKF